MVYSLSEVIFLDPSGRFVRHYSSLSDSQNQLKMARCILLSEVIFLDPSGWFVRHYSSLSDTQTAEIPYYTLQQEAVKLVGKQSDWSK